jgi:hypothetical protein
VDSSVVGYDDGWNVREARRVGQEQQPKKPVPGDRLLRRLGTDPSKWTIPGRVLALLGFAIGLAVVISVVCGYVFGWEWTGLPPQRVPKNTQPTKTLWDWLDLLIVPVVLALGGYFFTRSESQRTQDIAEQQRTLDRQLAEEQRQDDTLQAYLDGMAQLLTDKDRPLHRAQVGDSLSTVARARTLTVLTRLDPVRKGSVVRFLHEAGLITRACYELG